MMIIIAGKFKKRRLEVPKTDKVRPTTSMLREALFNICQDRVEGSHFLDLFAGSGAMGLEALSRGALSATFVEQNRQAFATIKKNIANLQVEKECRVYQQDVLKALPRLHEEGEKFDLIYVDPPYGMNLGRAVLDFVDAFPLLTETGSLFIEDSSLHEPSLKNLKLYGERKLGRAHLYEYRFNSRNV